MVAIYDGGIECLNGSERLNLGLKGIVSEWLGEEIINMDIIRA